MICILVSTITSDMALWPKFQLCQKDANTGSRQYEKLFLSQRSQALELYPQADSFLHVTGNI